LAEQDHHETDDRAGQVAEDYGIPCWRIGHIAGEPVQHREADQCCSMELRYDRPRLVQRDAVDRE
jgi:hypothetical protein